MLQNCQPRRLRYWKLLQQYCVDRGEQSSVCSNPERERQDSGCGKARIFAALPKREAKIAAHVFDTSETSLIAIAFFCRFDGAEFPAGRLQRFVRLESLFRLPAGE